MHTHARTHKILSKNAHASMIEMRVCVQYVEQMIEYSFYVFTVLLVLEIMLKVVAFGVLRFIKNR